MTPPLTDAPEIGSAYFTPSPLSKNLCLPVVWSDNEVDRLWLERGLIHATRDAAVAHAKTMIRSKQS